MNSILEIRYYTGDVERRALFKNQPVSIGKHTSNDICIDDADVAIMHCRISWKKDSYEVMAANLEGVEVNGTLCRTAPLGDGDVLRIGPVDILIHTDVKDSPDRDEADGPVSAEIRGIASEVDLKPVSEEEIFFPLAKPSKRETPSPTATASKESGGKAGKQNKKPSGGIASEDAQEDQSGTMLPDDVYDDLLEDFAEKDRDVEQQMVLNRSTTYDDEFGDVDRTSKKTASAKPLGESLKKLRSQLRSRPVRPGEQDIVRSPLVLTLGWGSLILILLGATFWYMFVRETSSRDFEAAATEFEQGRYAQAIGLFEQFLKQHPRDPLIDTARIELGKVRVERQISGSPSWGPGMEALKELITQNRDRGGFADQYETVRKYAESIALGAAKTSEKAQNLETEKRRDLLQVSTDGRRIIERYPPPEGPQTELLNQILAAYERAEAAITKQEVFNKAAEEIKTALDENDPMSALSARRKLLRQYADFESNPQLVTLLSNTLDTERQRVVREEMDRDAIRKDRMAEAPAPLSLTWHTRLRTDENSDERTVFAVAKDCCYGIDKVTGDPVWRRVIGLDTPFFPMTVSTSVPGLLMFDTNHSELVLVNQRQGELLWRQPIQDHLAGPPLVRQGQIYLPTLGKHLFQIDLESGRISTRLRFSQKVLAPPVLVSSGTQLLVAGDKEVFYRLSLRPLECRGVAFVGHAADSIVAPLVPMGSLVLMTENDRMAGSRLRVFDTASGENKLPEVATARIDGQVRNAPVLRGRQLIVTSSPERIAAYTVSDDKEQKPLTFVARHQVQSEHPGLLFLTAGADGQLWMAGSALRKFQVETDNIVPDTRQIAAGQSTQPLQIIGRDLFIGRRLPYSGAVVFTQADRDQMTSHWRTVVGSSLLTWSDTPQGTAVCLNEGGELFRVTEKEILAGGFKQQSTTQLKLAASLSEPLRARRLGKGRIAVWSAGAEPQLWIVNSIGQIDRRISLPEPLEANPVELSAGIVLPLPGRLMLMRSRSSTARSEDYLAPLDKEKKARWSQLAVLDQDQLLALDDRGFLVRVQYRTSPVASLTAVTQVQLENPVDVRFALADGKLMLADSSGRLQMLDASSLEPLSAAKLDTPASNALWAVKERLFVETGRGRLRCFEISPELKQLWSIPLGGTGLSGRPLRVADKLVVTKQDGSIWALDPTDGTVSSRLNVGQPLNLGPRLIGSSIVVPSVDGSLYHIESILQPSQEAAAMK